MKGPIPQATAVPNPEVSGRNDPSDPPFAAKKKKPQNHPSTCNENLVAVSWSLGPTGRNSWLLEISQGGKQPYTLECWPKRWDGAPLACTQAGWFGEMVWVEFQPDGGRTAGFLYNFFLIFPFLFGMDVNGCGFSFKKKHRRLLNIKMDICPTPWNEVIFSNRSRVFVGWNGLFGFSLKRWVPSGRRPRRYGQWMAR